MDVPQTGFEQPAGTYQQYHANYAAHAAQYGAMSLEPQPWNQTQPQTAYNSNSNPYMNCWPSASADPPTPMFSQSGVPPQYHGHQPQPLNYEGYSQSSQNFDTPQVQGATGPTRIPRRQMAQGMASQADPTRGSSSALRSERSRGKRGDDSASSHPTIQPQDPSASQPPTTAIPDVTSTSAWSGPGSASHTQVPLSIDGGSPNTTTGTAGGSSAQDAIPVDGTKKKSRLSNLDRRDICIYQRDTPGVRQEDIAQRWGVERSTISKILKEKNRWLFISIDETVEVHKARPPKFEEINEKLKEWCFTKHEIDSSISDKEIHDKALEFAQGSASAIKTFKASHGWIDAFKNRVGIRKGVFLGEGTANEQNRAMGNGAANLPAPMDFGPTMMDNLYRNGEWDPTDCDFIQIPMWKVPIQVLTERRGGRPWHELTKEEQEASEAAGDNDMYPPYQMAVGEAKLEDQALAEAEEELFVLEDAAIAAGEPFDRKATFDEIMHEKLAAIDYETVDVPELDVPTIPGQHPDDMEPTPGPSGERAHEAIWDVIRFCMPRRGRVFSNAHCAVLLEIWARTMIIRERQRRAGARRQAYEAIYFKDRKNDEKHAEEMIAEKEKDFALNPTGEPTGRDVVARQMRKEDLENLRELKNAHDELVQDPKQAAWLDRVHDARREEDPNIEDDAPVVSSSPSRFPPLHPDNEPVASTLGYSSSSPAESSDALAISPILRLPLPHPDNEPFVSTSGSSSSSPAGSSGALLTPRPTLQDDGIEIYTPTSLPPEGTFLHRVLTNPNSPLASVQIPAKPWCPEDFNWTSEQVYGGAPPGSHESLGLNDPGTAWTGPGLFGDSPGVDPPDVDMAGMPPTS